MAERKKKWRGEGSHWRSQGNEYTERAEESSRRAWRCLALAGAPRVPRTVRDKLVAEAAQHLDAARGALTTGRTAFLALEKRVDAAEERMRKAPAGGDRWTNYSSEAVSEKAGVTMLQPVVVSLTADLRSLGECLRRHGGDSRRSAYHVEKDAAVRLRSVFGLDPPFQRCNWCSKPEARYDVHIALDAEGFACRREEGRRFCCDRCFSDAKDLEEPAPKPLPPEPAAPEPAYAEVNPPRALPARRLALPAHVPIDEPPGPGGER